MKEKTEVTQQEVENVFARYGKVVIESLMLSDCQPQLSDRLEDLGADSLDVLTIITKAEKEFGVRIDSYSWDKGNRLQQNCEDIARRLKETGQLA